jgi:hypothetical protein
VAGVARLRSAGRTLAPTGRACPAGARSAAATDPPASAARPRAALLRTGPRTAPTTSTPDPPVNAEVMQPPIETATVSATATNLHHRANGIGRAATRGTLHPATAPWTNSRVRPTGARDAWSGLGRRRTSTQSVQVGLANSLANAVASSWSRDRSGTRPRPDLVLWCGAPRRNRTGDPILTIRVVPLL